MCDHGWEGCDPKPDLPGTQGSLLLGVWEGSIPAGRAGGFGACARSCGQNSRRVWLPLTATVPSVVTARSGLGFSLQTQV